MSSSLDLLKNKLVLYEKNIRIYILSKEIIIFACRVCRMRLLGLFPFGVSDAIIEKTVSHLCEI